MSFKSKCKNVEHYSGCGKVFLSDGNQVVFHSAFDFEVFNYGVNSNLELFLDEEIVVALGRHTTRQQTIAALKRVLEKVEKIPVKRWRAEADDLAPKPPKRELKKRVTN